MRLENIESIPPEIFDMESTEKLKIVYDKVPNNSSIWSDINDLILNKKINLSLHFFNERKNLHSIWKSFEFIEEIPNIESLYISNSFISNLDFIKNLNNLKLFSITSQQELSLEALKDNNNITHLSIMGSSKHIEIIQTLGNLTRLELRELSMEDINLINECKKLEYLMLFDFGVRNKSKDHYLQLDYLKYLGLYHLENFQNLDFISELESLICLHVYNSPIKDLQSFKKLGNLQKIRLSGLSRLKDLQTLEGALKLRELYISTDSSKKLSPNDFKTLITLPNLSVVSVGFGSRKTKEFEKLIEETSITDYPGSSHDFSTIEIWDY